MSAVALREGWYHPSDGSSKVSRFKISVFTKIPLVSDKGEKSTRGGLAVRQQLGQHSQSGQNTRALIKSLALRPAVCFYSRMRKESSLPVRLEEKDKQQLLRVTESMSLTPSCLIRILVRAFVEAYDRSGGIVELPLRIKPSGKNKETER